MSEELNRLIRGRMDKVREQLVVWTLNKSYQSQERWVEAKNLEDELTILSEMLRPLGGIR